MPARVPVMVPSPQARRGLAVVRERRLLVEDDALVLRHEGGRREVLAAPGDVVAAWWTPVAAAAGVRSSRSAHSTVTDAVVLVRRSEPPLVLRLADWLPVSGRTPYDVVHGTEVAGWPGPPEEPSLSAAVRLSGAQALVAALGVPLVGAAGPARLDELRRALAGGSRTVPGTAAAPRALTVLAVTALVAAAVLMSAVFFALVDPGPGTHRLLVAMGLLAAVTVGVRTVLQVRGARLRDEVALPGVVLRPAPVVATSRRFVERALLAVGPEWLVVRDQHDREAWTPGPAQGGAGAVRVAWPWLGVHDAEDARLWVLRLDEWTDRAGLEAWLEPWRAAGYDLLDDALPGPRETAWQGVPVLPGAGERVGLLGAWSSAGVALCAVSVAVQLRVLADPSAQRAVDPPSSWWLLPPALAVLLGLAGALVSRRDRLALTRVRPPARAARSGRQR